MADRSAAGADGTRRSRSCARAAPQSQHSLAGRARVEPRYDTFFVSRSHAAFAFFFDNASAISFYRPHRVVFAVWNSLRILFRVRLSIKIGKILSVSVTWENVLQRRVITVVAN